MIGAEMVVIQLLKGATNQGMQKASRSWKRQGKRLNLQKECSPANTLILSLETHSRPLTSRTVSE